MATTTKIALNYNWFSSLEKNARALGKPALSPLSLSKCLIVLVFDRNLNQIRLVDQMRRAHVDRRTFALSKVLLQGG